MYVEQVYDHSDQKYSFLCVVQQQPIPIHSTAGCMRVDLLRIEGGDGVADPVCDPSPFPAGEVFTTHTDVLWAAVFHGAINMDTAPEANGILATILTKSV